MISIKQDTIKFNETLKKYLELNRRDPKGLVEHTLKKVVTGFSPRSASAIKIEGLRQGFYKERATRTKIVSEFKQRESAKRGTLRPPKHYVSPTAKRSKNKRYPRMGLARTKWQAIGFRSRRGTAWVQATMLYKTWRPNNTAKVRKYKPTLDSKHGGRVPPNTGVQIKTTGDRVYARWYSELDAVTKNKHYRKVRKNALRNVRLDMLTYIKRKQKENKRKFR